MKWSNWQRSNLAWLPGHPALMSIWLDSHLCLLLCRLDVNSKANRLDRDQCMELWKADARPSPPKKHEVIIEETSDFLEPRLDPEPSLSIDPQPSSDSKSAQVEEANGEPRRTQLCIPLFCLKAQQTIRGHFCIALKDKLWIALPTSLSSKISCLTSL